MKRSLRYVDLILLRIIPTAFLLLILYADIQNSLQAFKRFEHIDFLLFLPGSVLILCFVLLGAFAILKFFKKAQKVAVILKRLICVLAVMYIGLYSAQLFKTIKQCISINYYPKFFGSFVDAQKLLYIIVIIIVAICLLLKEKFFKTKWALAVICSILYFVASFLTPLYTLINYNDAINFRFLLNSFLYCYSYCAVILSGLSPSKTERKVAEKNTNEEN